MERKCLELIDRIVSLLPKMVADMTTETYYWMMSFLVDVMLAPRHGPVFDRCMAIMAYETTRQEKQQMRADVTQYFLDRYGKTCESHECDEAQTALIVDKKQAMVWKVVLDDCCTVHWITKRRSGKYNVRCQVTSKEVNQWFSLQPPVGLVFSAFCSMTGNELSVYHGEEAAHFANCS